MTRSTLSMLALLPALLVASCGPAPAVVERAPSSTDEAEGDTAETPPHSSPRARARVTPRPDRSVDGWQAFDVHESAGVSERQGPVFMTGVWGAAPDDVYAVGNDGLLLHFDGHTWSALPSPATSHYGAVWGHSGEVFIAGMGTPRGGIIRHFDGQDWNDESTPPAAYFSALSGSGPDDVFAVGAGGAIMHYDGQRWQAQPSGTDRDLLGVWCTSATDVVAVGHEGTVLHYDGTAWSTVAVRASAHLRAVWASSSADVYVAGDEVLLHFDGDRWQPHPMERAFLHGVSGNGPTDVIAVGSNGAVVRFDGQAFRRRPPTVAGGVRSPGGNVHMLDTTFTADLTSVWAAGPNHFFAVGRGTLYVLADTN